MRSCNLWTGGNDATSAGAETTVRTSPAHGGDRACFALGTVEDLNAAVTAAKSARDGWLNTSAMERAAPLTKLADLMQDNLDELVEIEAEEVGKPIEDGYAELSHSMNLTRCTAALAWEMPGRAQTHHGTTASGIVSYEPIGVVGMITPSNFQAVTLIQESPYALAAS